MKLSDTKIAKIKQQVAKCDDTMQAIASLSFSDVKVKAETEEQKEIRKADLLNDYGKFFEYYFGNYADAPCADYHLEIANNIANNKFINQLNIIYRSGAKSTHSNLGIPFWLMCKRELKLMALIGANEEAAKMLLQDIQREFEENERIINDYGLLMKSGAWSDRKFKTTNGTMFMAFGLNQSLRGLRNGKYRVDYLVVDDVDNRETAESPKQVNKAVRKILGAAKGAFGRDTKRFVFSNNLIHKNGITAVLEKELIKSPFTKITKVNALDENGNPTWSYYSKEYWEKVKADLSTTEWLTEFMNNPVNVGRIFKDKWFQYKEILPLKEYDQIIAYGDLAYEDTGCTKAIIVVGRIGEEFHLIDCAVRESLSNVIEWYYKFDKKNPNANIQLHIEGNASQKGHYKMFFNTGYLIKAYRYIFPIWDLDQKGNKWNRISTLEGFFINGNIFFNETIQKNKDFIEFLNQLLNFEKGTKTPVDAPDAFHGAISKLNKSKASNIGNVLESLKIGILKPLGF